MSKAKKGRARKGSGCVYRVKFKTKDGVEKLGGWRIKGTANGRTFNEGVPAQTKREAQEYLAERLSEVRRGTFVPGSESESLRYEDMRAMLFRAYELEGRRSLGTLRDGTPSINHLRFVDEFFRDRLALAIDKRLVEDFVIERQRAGAANGTIDREVRLLMRMFKLAVGDKRLRGEHVPTVARLKGGPPRSGFLEPEDFPRLRVRLPEHLRAIATLAYTTGMRAGEVLGLRWENVDLLGGVLRLERTKNGETRTVPLSPEVLDRLKVERSRHASCPWVFSRDGVARVGSFRKSWRSACVGAGLGRFVCRACSATLGASRRCGACKRRGARYVGLIFHDLRRSGVRNLVRAGAPETVAMAISGHKTRNVFDRYNITSERDLHDAMRRATAYSAERAAISKSLVKVEREESADDAARSARIN